MPHPSPADISRPSDTSRGCRAAVGSWEVPALLGTPGCGAGWALVTARLAPGRWGPRGWRGRRQWGHLGHGHPRAMMVVMT